MKFKELSTYLERLEKTPSRIEITKILAELFKKAKPDEIDKITYLLLGRVAPNYKGIIFNIADKMVIRILARAYSQSPEKVAKMYKRKGDLGVVAQDLARGKGSNLETEKVYEKLLKITKEQGEESQERKISGMAEFLSSLDPLSARYVTRIPLGRLRLGFSDKTILDALSWMEKGDKSGRSQLTRAYEVLPDVGLLAKEVKAQGIEKASRNVTPKLGIPVMPVLAQRLKSPEEMVEKMGRVAVEPKFDGLRLSIHFRRSKGSKDSSFVKAFTRNLNETSWMFPELQKINEVIRSREVILDAEAIGLDENTKKLADFQATMTRRRKHQIEQALAKVRLEFFVFDILYVDGKSLMHEPFIKRRRILEKTLKENETFKLVQQKITQKPEEIAALYSQAIGEGLEGVLVKKVDSPYIPGRTGWRWVKMKQTEKTAGKLADTVDAVVMGYTAGKGKRVMFGLGQFLVGVRKGNSIKTVTKVGSGLTDKQFIEFKKRLAKLKTKMKPKEYDVHKDHTPDFWIVPEVVVEVAADEITRSPKHTAGLALRFPKLVRFRDDKSPDQATTLSEVESLYKLQKS